MQKETEAKKTGAVVVFEDSEGECGALSDLMPNGLHLILLKTIDQAYEFLQNEKKRLELLFGLPLIVAIVDGNLLVGDVSGDTGKDIISRMRESLEFNGTLILSNTGSGALDGADAHLKKLSTLKRKNIPRLHELHEQWKSTGQVTLFE